MSASLTYSGCHVPIQYDTYFYFTDGAVWIKNGLELWVSKNAEPYARVELDYDTSFFSKQLTEFVKFLKGEENEMVTAEYAREVIAVLEKAFSQIG